MVARSVVAGDTGSIKHDGDGKAMETYVVVGLIKGSRKEGRVHRHDGSQPTHRHTCGSGHLVLFGNTNIDESIGETILEGEQTGWPRHRCGERDDPVIQGANIEQRSAECLGVRGYRWLIIATRRRGLSNLEVMETLNFIVLCGAIAATFLREYVHQDGSIPVRGIF